MLEYWYKERRTLVDFRRGLLGKFFDGFAEHLKKLRYSPAMAKVILGRSCLFNDWLIENGVEDCKLISEAHIESFLDTYLENTRTAAAYSPRADSRRAMRIFTNYLVEIEVIAPFPLKIPPKKPYSKILAEFLEYLKSQWNLHESTIDSHRRRIIAFLEGISSDYFKSGKDFLTPKFLDSYIRNHLHASPENLRSLTATLRKFLRFCVINGYASVDLSGLVPAISSYRHASLPKGMEDSTLDRLLKSIQKDTDQGVRDYAIMLLLMAYGIRGKSVAEILLEDIRWQSSTIRIRAQKGGKEVVLPLLDEVGEAVIAYLRRRPESVFYREVFLSIKAPCRPMSSLMISQMVRKYMKRSGVKVPHSGTGTMRHSWAIRALANDSPIKAIADVLGHRYVDTTFIYAKADLKMLRYVAMPWPEER